MGANCSNITYTNENLTEYVWNGRGQRCLSQTMVIVTVVVYSVILFLGIFGNLLTCLVIAKNAGMHTATNYYLFSLAISDLLSLVLGLPFELHSSITSLWPDILPEVLCKLRSAVTEMTSYASVLTITAFSIERWLAICFPLKVKIFSKLDRAVKVIVGIWILAFACATPVYVFTMLNRLRLPESMLGHVTPSNLTDADKRITDDGLTVRMTDICALELDNLIVQKTLINFSFWTFFVAPLLIISILYAHIGWTIHKASKDTIKHDLKKLRRRKTVINMLVAVVVAFFICWLPFHIQRLSTLYVDLSNLGPTWLQFFSMIFYVSGYFYYANAAVNPILYSVLNDRFRKALLVTVCFCMKTYRQNTLRRLNAYNGVNHLSNPTVRTTTGSSNVRPLPRHLQYIKRNSDVSNSSTQFDSLVFNSSCAASGPMSSSRQQNPTKRL